jgi:integrase
MATKHSTRLTDRFIRSLKPPASGYDFYTDGEVPGFGMRVTSAGGIAFVLDYRLDGRNRRGTLGRWPEWSASVAREEAIERRRLVSRGIDPFEENIETLEQLADDYIKMHAEVKKSARAALKDRQMLDRLILPEFGKQTRIDKITTKKIEALHISMKATPYQANRVLALLSKMFSLAVKWKSLPENPCKGIEKFPENPRERYLHKDELKRLVVALDAFPDRNIASAIALMMLTGCRKTEALRAEWNQFDLEQGVWTKPSHHTKQKRVHRVPLNAAAVELLKGIHRIRDKENPYVFPGRVEGQPLQDIKKAWEAIRQAALVPDLRMHDLRHSYASMLASQNLSLPIIGQLLGHTQAQTTKRYAHLLDEPLKEATNLVGQLVDSARTAVK